MIPAGWSQVTLLFAAAKPAPLTSKAGESAIKTAEASLPPDTLFHIMPEVLPYPGSMC